MPLAIIGLIAAAANITAAAIKANADKRAQEAAALQQQQAIAAAAAAARQPEPAPASVLPDWAIPAAFAVGAGLLLRKVL